MEYHTQDREIISPKPCHHCRGKGYLDIRDCSGEIQRSENCSFCDGLGYVEINKVENNYSGDRLNFNN